MTKAHKRYNLKKVQPIKEINGNDFNIISYNREKLGYSKEEIANKMGVSLRQIQRVERMYIGEGPCQLSLMFVLNYLDELGLEMVIRKKKDQ